MAAPSLASLHATPEHWTELIAARRQRRLCSEQVESLKRSCARDCGKRHVSECATCYGKVLERMRRRYSESEAREWFTQRKAFLQELDGLFADAKECRKNVKLIEARIESEKEAWYRWVLRKYPEFLAACDDSAHYDGLRGLLDDPDLSRDEVVGMMWQGIGKPPHWPERVDALAAKVEAAEGDEAALRKIYVDEFFADRETGEILEKARPYLDEFEANPHMKLEEVIGRIARDGEESRSTQPLRDSHKRRLDELRRAKTAFEQNKLQAKSQAKEAQEPAAGEDLYDLPTCSVCQRAVDTNDVWSCSVCQVVTQMGGDKRLTVYCSERCYDTGHGKHIEKYHDCEGREHCVQFYDEDVIMEDGVSAGTFACKECFGEKQAVLFCSERCALENIAGHRERRHGVKTAAAAEEVPSLVTPLREAVDSVLRRENPGLKISSVH